MRITRELLNELTEKRRNEYLAKKEKIVEETPIFSIVVQMFYIMICVVAFFMIIIPLWKMAFGLEIAISLAQALLGIARVFPAIFTAAIVIDIFIMFVGIYRIDKLKKEYFDFIVKVRKK